MRQTNLRFASYLALTLAFVASAPVEAAQRQLGGSGALGYVCKASESGSRYCTCQGGMESHDCKVMRAEVCVDQHIDACFDDDKSCQCKWKLRKAPVPNLGGKLGAPTRKQ